VYEKIRLKIKYGIETIQDVEFQNTKELGRVNRVDPLGITFLRIRGMWGIENPFKVFDYLLKRDTNCNFNFMAIINESKWKSLEGKNKLEKIISMNPNSKLFKGNIKNPDNPAILKKAYVISLEL
jgi:hypothetical protein